jgi:hypothetical protein
MKLFDPTNKPADNTKYSKLIKNIFSFLKSNNPRAYKKAMDQKKILDSQKKIIAKDMPKERELAKKRIAEDKLEEERLKADLQRIRQKKKSNKAVSAKKQMWHRIYSYPSTSTDPPPFARMFNIAGDENIWVGDDEDDIMVATKPVKKSRKVKKIKVEPMDELTEVLAQPMADVLTQPMVDVLSEAPVKVPVQLAEVPLEAPVEVPVEAPPEETGEVMGDGFEIFNKRLRQYRRKNPGTPYRTAQRNVSEMMRQRRSMSPRFALFLERLNWFRGEYPEIPYREAQQMVSQAMKDLKI